MPTKKEIREYNQYLKRKVLGLFDDYTTKHKNKNLPTALSSNIQQKKNREFLKKDLKRLGFEGTAFSKYGSYKFSKSAEEFVTKYANKQGFNGRVFRKTGETYSTFDTFVRSPLKPTGRRDKLMINYTVTKIETGKVGLDDKGETENTHLTTYHDLRIIFITNLFRMQFRKLLKLQIKKPTIVRFM